MHIYHSGKTSPLDSNQLEAILDDYLDADLQRLDTEPTAIALAKFKRSKQDRALYWIKVGAKAHTEIGYCLALNAAKALALMNDKMMQTWVLHSMEILDTQGLVPAVQLINNVEKFALEAEDRARGVTFADVSGMLSLFVQGLSGRRLKLQQADSAWTDTETLYLPSFVGRFESHENNFKHYKSILAYQWAQIWFGSWRVERVLENSRPELSLSHFLKKDPQSRSLQLDYLQRLEAIRLDACISRELPGIHRDMQTVLGLLNESVIPPGWESLAAQLQQPHSSITSSCQLIQDAMQLPLPKPHCFQGVWKLDELLDAMQIRLNREKQVFQKALWKASQEILDKNKNQKNTQDEEQHKADTSEKTSRLKLSESDDTSLPQDFRIEITLDDEPLKIDWETRESMNSILQDFGDIPEEYLQTGGAGAYDAEQISDKKADDLWAGTYHEEGALYYDEWDYQRQHYRKDWCVLREQEVKPGKLGFVQDTLQKYHKEIKQIHKSFEALRGEDKLLKQQVNGDDIDIDAFVEAWSDTRLGMEMTDRLYTQMQRVDRSIAVMLMVDMSGSTKGWINKAEREALILLCEALEKLGDRYAIYGFSGWARKRCDIFKIKSFEESYSGKKSCAGSGSDSVKIDYSVQSRIAGIEAQEYTRMGVAIRHLAGLLNQVSAKTRILITLSDGRPEDYGEYRGKYGIEDTRMALIEARRTGVHPFCITIDKAGLDYLPYMYGAASYVVLDDVAQLPLKVADIYRKLTT